MESSSGDRSHQQYAEFITMGLLALIAVILRFIARSRPRVTWGLDDAFVVLALLTYWTLIAVSLWGVVDGGHGKALTAIPLPEVIISLKVLYIGVMFTVATISAVKLSVLFFYYRIFQINRKFKIAWVVLLFASIAWFLGCFFLAIFRCTPISAAWNPLAKPGQCINLQRAFLITETINCVTDLAIVLLPVGMIGSLQLPMRMKFGLSLVFMLGGFVCVTSIIRIIYTYNSDASSSSIFYSGVWINIQLCAAIICACLPTYRPILPSKATLSKLRSYPAFFTSRSRSSRRTTSHASSSQKEPSDYSISADAVDREMRTDVKLAHGAVTPEYELSPLDIEASREVSSYGSHV